MNTTKMDSGLDTANKTKKEGTRTGTLSSALNGYSIVSTGKYVHKAQLGLSILSRVRTSRLVDYSSHILIASIALDKPTVPVAYPPGTLPVHPMPAMWT